MESRSPYPKLWKEWRSYKIVLWVIRSPLNYLQYIAKWDPKRGVTPICTFRYVRSGTQILHHVPGSFGNPFSKKITLILVNSHLKKRNIFLKIFCSSFFLSKKTRQKQGGEHWVIFCRFLNLMGDCGIFCVVDIPYENDRGRSTFQEKLQRQGQRCWYSPRLWQEKSIRPLIL